MNKLMLISLWVLATSIFTVNLNKSFTVVNPRENKKTKVIKENKSTDPILDLYQEMKLDKTIKWEAFQQAMQGYNQLNPKNKDIISIIDFTLPSTEKRMYVLDVKSKKILFHNIVSHGKNSGDNFATSFSNTHGSFQSSLGFYLTQETYQGGNGFSLRLNGIEKGINDQARPRAIVVHGADYCSQKFIKSTGRLGRSYGCPALPRELTKPIINTIKNGSIMFIYAGNKEYIANSKLFREKSPSPSKTLIASYPEIDIENNSLN